jgi:D-sedoheptulose 7-phosphate isomerase
VASAGRDFVVAQFQQSIETPTRFFEANADRVSQACFAMAQRFHRGGRLLVFGNGSSTTDAQHVSVEFVHPVIVGKQALPAMALTNDIAAVLGLAQRAGLKEIFAQQVRLLGAREDIALGLTVGVSDESVTRGLAAAKQMGMLTIGMCGAGGSTRDGEMAQSPEIDFCFSVPSDSPHVVQEVQETTYHILWETVHVFFEHQGLLEDIQISGYHSL